MGRSVSYADNSEHIAYSTLSTDRYYCSCCGATFNEYQQEDGQDCCPSCNASAEDCSEQDPGDDWDWYCEDFQREMIQAFPSLSECDERVGREDRALLENSFCRIGVSEYCGLVSMWVQPKELSEWYSDERSKANLRDRWIAQIGPKFHKVASTCFGQPLHQVGRFSNGEAIFIPTQGPQRGALGLGYSSKEGWL